MMNRAELWSMLPDGGQQRALIEGIYPGAQARFSPDNQQVLFLAGANDAFEPYYNAKVFLLPAAGGKHQRLFADHSFEVLNAEWSADGEAIIFLANTGVRADLFQYHLATGALTQLTSGDHGIRGWHYLTGRGLHALVVADAHSNGDIWVLDERSPNQLSQVTHLHDHLPTTFKLPRLDAVQWPGEDGVEVEGLLYYPVDYREGQRYPLVALTHGGPAFSDHFGLGDPYDYAPVLAGHGYLVFQPNYRGSTGYGDEHLRDSVGHYFNQMHRDVMTGVDALIERGLADPDRLIKMGYSAGGVLTKKIVTYTDRFKAASAGAGCTSWLSMYYLGDLRGHRHAWFGGTPWSHQAQEGEPWPADAPIHLYWEHSPLKYAAHVTTPTLLFFGEKDARNPMSEGIIFYRALKGNGVPTHLYITPGKDHGDWDPHQLLFKGNTELEWFARWVLDSSYTWEEAPQATGKVGPSTNENNSITIP
jgi:dipeptidyl aminopeptidase/acylaminoacyl peptidase